MSAVGGALPQKLRTMVNWPDSAGTLDRIYFLPGDLPHGEVAKCFNMHLCMDRPGSSVGRASAF